MTYVHDLTKRLEENREQISEWMAKKRSEVPNLWKCGGMRDGKLQS